MSLLNIKTLRHVFLLSWLMDVEDSSETWEFRAVLMVYGGENFTLSSVVKLRKTSA